MNGVGGSEIVEGMAWKANAPSLTCRLSCPKARTEVGLSRTGVQLKLFTSIINYNPVTFRLNFAVDFGG